MKLRKNNQYLYDRYYLKNNSNFINRHILNKIFDQYSISIIVKLISFTRKKYKRNYYNTKCFPNRYLWKEIIKNLEKEVDKERK